MKAGAANYNLTVTAGGKPLGNIEVMLYMRDPGGQIQNKTVKTNAKGKLSFPVPSGFIMAFVEPIPYAGYWIMLAEAPASGSTIDCLPIAKAKSGGEGWWHDAMGVDVSKATRGAGIKVGVIDTGCGPHRNLAHVTLVGAFVDGKVLAPARDTHLGHCWCPADESFGLCRYGAGL
jgi:subtilisin